MLIKNVILHLQRFDKGQQRVAVSVTLVVTRRGSGLSVFWRGTFCFPLHVMSPPSPFAQFAAWTYVGNTVLVCSTCRVHALTTDCKVRTVTVVTTTDSYPSGKNYVPHVMYIGLRPQPHLRLLPCSAPRRRDCTYGGAALQTKSYHFMLLDWFPLWKSFECLWIWLLLFSL